MSGIGFAGLALTIFPLVVEGMQSLVSGVQKIDTWRKYTRKVNGYAILLNGEKLILRNSIISLLNGALSTEDLRDFLKEPSSERWKRPEYDKELQKCLRQDVKVYMDSISNLESLLQDLMRKIENLRPLSSAFTTKNSWTSTVLERGNARFQQLIFAFSWKEYDSLLDNIHTSNEIIRSLTTDAIQFQSMYSRQHIFTESVVDFTLIRNQSRSLYNACVKHPWKCPCRDQHVVNLRLEPRPRFILVEAKEEDERNDRFYVILWNEPARTTFSWKFPQIEIEPIETQDGNHPAVQRQTDRYQAASSSKKGK
ncbi:MAG: hypothetical protein M1834_007651 [Cirrosporium novae-zelandiae]|nr:MAG: hypothetical protein M1834_007651 [Cirrosporium novae-zelandiae]